MGHELPCIFPSNRAPDSALPLRQIQRQSYLVILSGNAPEWPASRFLDITSLRLHSAAPNRTQARRILLQVPPALSCDRRGPTRWSHAARDRRESDSDGSVVTSGRRGSK